MEKHFNRFLLTNFKAEKTKPLRTAQRSAEACRSRLVAQLVRALPSVLKVFSSILSDSNVCSYFSLICVAVALNTRKMEH